MNNPKMPIRATPFAHQQSAFTAALEMFESGTSRGYAYLFEMGLGKSITSVATAGWLYLNGKIQKVLVVAPLSIVGVWREEFEKFADFDYALAVLEGTTAKKADTLRHLTGKPLQVAVVNYESAWRLEAEILKWKPDIVIADEAHKLKTHNAAVSKAMHRIGAAAQYKLALTGTPVTNKALDVFSQMKYLNPAIFGTSFYSFRNRYFDMTGYGNHTPVLKKTMEPELTRKLHSIAFRATKAECLDLPPFTDTIIKVNLEPSAAKLYRELVKDSFTQLNGADCTATNVLTRLLRLSQLTGGFLGGDDNPTPQSVSTAKLDALAELIETAQESGQKLVIIARFIAEIDAIKKLLEKQHIGYSAISGEVKDRAEQVRKFQQGETEVFIGQIQCAGLGITLTAASTLVFYSTNYSMSDYEQTRARIHRVGQTEPCTYYHLVARGTVDEKVLKILRNKADPAKTLIDDYRNGNNPFA
jgi:SNF2 family DNA or RNA helicase